MREAITAAIAALERTAHTTEDERLAAADGLRAALAAPVPQPEPFWHAVVSQRAPIIDKAIRREDVASEYADKCQEQWPDVSDIEVVPLYRQLPSSSVSDRKPLTAAKIAELQDDGVFWGNCTRIVRAIEEEHGITAAPEGKQP